MSEHIVDLDPAVDDQPEFVDHPVEVTDEEAVEGQAAWEAIDDTDDNSNAFVVRTGKDTHYVVSGAKVREVKDLAVGGPIDPKEAQ